MRVLARAWLLAGLATAMLLPGAANATEPTYAPPVPLLWKVSDADNSLYLLGAFHVLRETKLPPLDALREHGVPMAVATVCNPGSSPLQSLRQAMQLACTHFRLTPEEALRGATTHAARALGLKDRGLLKVGMRADFVHWSVGAPAELGYWLGGRLARAVHAGGRRVA